MSHSLLRIPEHDLVPFRTSSADLVTLEEMCKIRDIVAVQSDAVSSWLSSRPADRGISIEQKVSIGRGFFKRTLKAKITVKTW